jgi:glycosyltransferase involved in cell wall biosynthesis
LENKKRHILFLCSWYPNPDEKSNGIFIKRHAQALSLQYHVTVLFAKSVNNSKEPLLIKKENENLEEHLYFYPKLSHKFPLISAAQKFRKLKQAYKHLLAGLPDDRRFDIIHVNTIFPAAIPALMALKAYPSAKLFITEHWSGYYPEDGNYRGTVLTHFTKQLVAKAKAVLVISEKLKQAMLGHGLKSNYELIHNTVDVSLFKPQRIQATSTGILQILHVSSLVEREKNISGIMAVAAELQKNNVAFHLSITGENANEINSHRKLLSQYNLDDKVTFAGFKTPTEVAELMNLADVFLLFSHYEGEPVVVLEALACGLPVISTNVGEIQNMIKPGMGIILETASVNLCAEALRTYRRTDFKPVEELNHHISTHYSPEAVSLRISELYNVYS